LSVRHRWPLRIVGLLVLGIVAIAPFEVSPGQREELPSFALDPEVEQVARYLEWRATASIDPALRREVATALMEEARYTGLDPLLILAVMAVESDFIPDAVSNAQAKGLLQLRDITVEEIVKHEELPAKAALESPEVVKMRYGIRYLALMMKRFPDQARALAAWNAGPGAVGRELAATGEVPDRWLSFARRVDRQHRRIRNYFGQELQPTTQAPTWLAAGPKVEAASLD